MEGDSWLPPTEEEVIDLPRTLPLDESRKESIWSVTNKFSDAQNYLDAMTEMSGTEKVKKMVS